MNKEMKEDLAVGGLAGGAISVAAGLLLGWPLGILVGGLAGGLLSRLRRAYLAVLQARISGGGIEWDVEVNGVKVGSISDADYARLRLAVFSDLRVYVAQLANLAWCACKVIDSLFIALPLSAFWLIVLGVAFAPDQAGDALRELQALSAAQLVAGVRAGLWLVPTLAVLYVALSVAFLGSRFGFVNRFAERSAENLRRRLGVPTVGQVSLVRFQNGGYVFNDEAVHAGLKRR